MVSGHSLHVFEMCSTLSFLFYFIDSVREQEQHVECTQSVTLIRESVVFILTMKCCLGLVYFHI